MWLVSDRLDVDRKVGGWWTDDDQPTGRTCWKKVFWPQLSHDPTETWLNHMHNLWLSSCLLQKRSLYAHTLTETHWHKPAGSSLKLTLKFQIRLECSLSVDSRTMARSPCQKRCTHILEKLSFGNGWFTRLINRLRNMFFKGIAKILMYAEGISFQMWCPPVVVANKIQRRMSWLSPYKTVVNNNLHRTYYLKVQN